MENCTTTKSVANSNSSLSSKRFRFDSFAMEFAGKEKDSPSPSVMMSGCTFTSSSKHIQASDVDNDSGIGEC